MAEPTIKKGSNYFFTTIYEGNGAGQRVGKFVPFTNNGTITNSCIFNDGDSAQLERTPSSNGNRRTFTVSAWVKRGALGTEQHICSSYDGSSTDNNSMWEFRFLAANTISISRYTDNILITNRTFEDTSKFYHLLMVVDTTQGTASNRVKLYVDGDEITSFGTDNRSSVAQDFDTAFNNTADACVVGNRKSQSKYFDGYMAEVNLVDGTALTPSTFGLTDTSTGRWIPKSLTGITYGTNGFRLQFGTSSALGDDTSGNNNDLSVSNLVASDQTTDSPTQNFATGLGAFQTSYAMTMSEGNLKSAASGGSGQHGKSSSTLTFDANDSDGYYCEYTLNVTSGVASNFNAVAITVDREAYSVPNASNGKVSGQVRYMEDGRFRTTNLAGTLTDISSWGSTWGNVSTPDIIGIFVKNNKIYFSKNGTWQNSADPNNETGGMDVEGTIGSNRVRFSHIGYQSGSTYGTMTANFGQKSFAYTPPTGYKKLNQDNLPTTDKGIPDFVWIKNRDATDNHQIYDSSRGKQISFAVTTAAQSTVSDGLQKFLKGGCQIEDDVSINTSGESYVAWNWVANGGTTSANTDGSGGTVASTIQANQTAGFSIVEFTAPSSGTAPFSVAHGLGKVPRWFMFKRKTGGTSRFLLFHRDAYDASNGGYSMELSAASTNTAFNTEFGSTSIYTSDPTATTFSLRTNSAVAAGQPYIAYCWAEIDGFSRFGEYFGNASTNGPLVYTGFKPSWLLVKNRQRATGWYLYDSKRTPFNEMDGHLFPNATTVETTGSEEIDFLSNGFKIRGNNAGNNRSAEAFIYMAFAEHPFIGSSSISPATAR